MIIQTEVEGQRRNVYIDDALNRGIEEKIKPKLKKKDYDWVWIIDGPEGSGKSVFAQQIAKILDPSFDLDRMCMTPDEFTKAILRAKKGQCVVFDEAFTGLSSRASLTEINRIIISLMMEMRQKNLLVIIVMPTFFLLDRYVALFRAHGLFHLYFKDGKRGQWVYFNKKKMKLLYLLGKKMFNYGKPKSHFRGRFYNVYTVNEEAYRKKKNECLMKKSRGTRAEVYKNQRDTLILLLHKVFNVNQVKLSKLCEEYGFKIKHNTLSEIITEMNKEYLKSKLQEETEQDYT